MANVLTSFAGVPLPTELPENASDYVTSLPESAFIVAECVGHELRNDSRGGEALWLAFKPEPGQKADGGVDVDSEKLIYSQRSFNGGGADITIKDLKILGWQQDAWEALQQNDIGMSGIKGKKVRLVIGPEEFNNKTTIRVKFINAVPAKLGNDALAALKARVAGKVQDIFSGKSTGVPKKDASTGSSPPPAVAGMTTDGTAANAAAGDNLTF
jgi:hypothetical protein